MQIEIHAPIDPAEDMTIYCEGKRLSQPTTGIFSHYWNESDLSKVLTEAQIKELEGGKYAFDVPAWKIKLLRGQKAAKDNTELKFLMQWD